MKFTPKYDREFQPIAVALAEFRRAAESAPHENLRVCVERTNGCNYVFELPIFVDGEQREKSYKLVERMIKAVLWVAGGYKIYLDGPRYIYDRIKEEYTPTGNRAFDYDFMSGVYEAPMQVIYATGEDFPAAKSEEKDIGGHLDGCRIGFDAGGSDRKVSAVVDGEVVYSEEVVWNPKLQSDYRYHVAGIKDSFMRAASKMPRVDAIGVSTAGVCIDNKVMVSSLFVKIPREYFHTHVKNMYVDIAREMGVPIEVANDGDVAALAGAIDLGDNAVLGIAMGTSEAGGYINANGRLNGWISELAFVPVDMNENAERDEWSGDIGCGVKYFSQDGIIKLALRAGIVFDEGSTPAEKLKLVQSLMEKGDERAREIYADIGVYLGYTIPFYAEFYDVKHLLLLGRVTSGAGGKIIAETAEKVLKEEYPELSVKIEMPDESKKRVGQSIAAASLTEIIRKR